ncbi:MAG: HEAT repeat domain-containing protein [Anaerolineae bacterium]|nr:HEAT repeat domain-containing protein [Anaerolineae bacterium]
MSKANWDSLVDQLRNPDTDVKTRRKACKQLAATGDPAVIPFLRNAFLQPDEDAGVREAARKGLAHFKAQHEGATGRSFPVSDRTLLMILGGLAAIFVISLILHGLTMLLGGDENNQDNQNTFVQLEPTGRDDLIAQISDQIQQTYEDIASIRSVIQTYNDTQTIDCQPTFNRPPGVQLSPVDRDIYRRDLTNVADNFNVVLLSLQKAQVRWDLACTTNEIQINAILEASAALDETENGLQPVQTALQQAIDNPPTPTPTPTATHTPTLSPTPLPYTATSQPTVQPTAENTATPTVTPTLTPTLTNTPSPTATLPYPALDYPGILRELRDRSLIMGDLDSNYDNGIINQWRAVQDPDYTATQRCTFDPWPAAFDFSQAQLAELARNDVADPELRDAVRLQQEGIALAIQARAMFEPDCAAGTLANSVAQGLPLAEQALEKLEESQVLADAIRARPAQ